MDFENNALDAYTAYPSSSFHAAAPRDSSGLLFIDAHDVHSSDHTPLDFSASMSPPAQSHALAHAHRNNWHGHLPPHQLSHDPHSLAAAAAAHQHQHQQQQQQQQPYPMRQTRSLSGPCPDHACFTSSSSSAQPHFQSAYAPAPFRGDHLGGGGTGTFGSADHFHAVNITPPPSEGDGSLSPNHNEWKPALDVSGPTRRSRRSRGDSDPPHSPIMRADGFRKKNAKFEIPADRNLDTVDALIEDAKTKGDDLALKELKTQKRLLRNREAALHSRQKKKDHTAKLEAREKLLECELGDVRHKFKDLSSRYTAANREHQMMQQTFGELQAERNSMSARHRREVDELRAQIATLSKTIQNSHDTPMSTVPSSSGYNDSAIGMPSDGTDWSYDMMNSLSNDFCIDPDIVSPCASDKTPHTSAATDSVVMLLLFGALGALQISPTLAASIPEPVRAAAPAIVDSLFKSARIESPGMLAPMLEQAGSNAFVNDQQTRSILSNIARPEVVLQFRQLVDEGSKSIKPAAEIRAN